MKRLKRPEEYLLDMCMVSEKLNEQDALKKLEFMLEKFTLDSRANRKKISELISNFARDILMNKRYKVSDQTEAILTSLLDLNHWGETEMPPTLSMKDIKKIIPLMRRIITKKKI